MLPWSGVVTMMEFSPARVEISWRYYVVLFRCRNRGKQGRLFHPTVWPLVQLQVCTFWPWLILCITILCLSLLKAFGVFLWILMVSIASIWRSWQYLLLYVGFPTPQTLALSNEISGKLCSLTWMLLLRGCVCWVFFLIYSFWSPPQFSH